MNSADVFEQIERMGELPSLPQTLLEIQKVASDDNSCAEDLAECILHDQALTMRVLKVVGSAMYRRKDQEQIRTVHRAVVVMGFETVRKLALGLSVFDMMSKLSRSPYLAVITRHSVVCAGFAQVLAEAAGMESPEEAFVTGLVHDIGKVVLLECSPEAMDHVLNDLAGGIPSLEAERKRFGITHDRAGRRLAARWNLPTGMQSIIGDHHDIDPLNPPRNLDRNLACIVYANALSRFTGHEDRREAESAILRQAGKALGIPASRLDGVAERAREELGDLAGLIGMETGDLNEFGQLVNVDGSVNVAPKRMTVQEVSRRTAKQLELYREVGAGMAEGQDPEGLLDAILEGAVEILGFERVIYLRADRTARVLRPWRWAGLETARLAHALELPLTRTTGALALSVLEHRMIHVPEASSEAYAGLVGEEVLRLTRCTGFVVAPVATPDGVEGVIYADCGPEGDDVVAEQAAELEGLALQAGLVVGRTHPIPSS